MSEGEVPSCADVLLFEVDVVDGEEVRVKVVEVIEDPAGLGGALADRVGPWNGEEPVGELGQPVGAFPSFFSACPSARSMISFTIRSNCASFTALDCSKAM